MLVDQDHCFRHGVQDRLELGLPVTYVFRLVQKPVTDEAENWSQDREGQDIDQVCGIGIKAVTQEENRRAEAQDRGEKRRTTATGKVGKHHSRNVNDRKTSTFEKVIEDEADDEYDQRRGDCRSVSGPETPPRRHRIIRPVTAITPPPLIQACTENMVWVARKPYPAMLPCRTPEAWASRG